MQPVNSPDCCPPGIWIEGAVFNIFAAFAGGTIVPNVSLSFLTRRALKQVCRVCHELAELKPDRLCPVCTHIKAKIQSRFAEAIRRTIAIPAQQYCKRSGCTCAACDTRTLDPHPLYVFELARAGRREVHLHPRCHELWLEAAGLDTRPKDDAATGQGDKSDTSSR